MGNFYIKTNRVYTSIRKYAWLFVPLVAFGGLWYPKLGLLMIPIMLSLMVLGLFRGKYWCGNICPHGSLFDGVILPVSINKKIPAFLKSKITIALVFSWFMYIITSRLIKAFQVLGTASFLDKLGYVFVFNYFAVTIVGTILAIIITPRAWCSICPMGTMGIILYRLGTFLGINRKTDLKVTAVQSKKCYSCGKCSKVCPMQLAPYKELSENNQLNNVFCIRCSVCVSNCPAGFLSLKNKFEAGRTKEKDKSVAVL